MDVEKREPTQSANAYQNLAGEIVKLLRGEMSQRELSESLGFTFNQVGKWESGFTQIKWSDFLRFAEFRELPVEKAFRLVFWTHDGPFDVLTSVNSLAKQIGFRPDSIRGERTDLAEILRWMDHEASILISWLTLFLDCSKLPTIEAKVQGFMLRLNAILSDPLCVFVNAALDTSEYRNLELHDEVLLAEHSTCTREELRRTLETLMTFKAVTFDGKKYRPVYSFAYSFSPNPKLRSLTKYATELAASRYSLTPVEANPDRPTNVSLSSVRVVPMSLEASKKVRELVAQFHVAVGDVVNADDAPKDGVQVLLFHSFVSNINVSREKIETNSLSLPNSPPNQNYKLT